MKETRNHKIINDEQALEFNLGREQALSFFYHEFYPALVHYSFQLTENRSIAEEVASEAFVKTWRMHAKLDSYGGIKAYLYKVVHRDSIDAIAKEQRLSKSFKTLPPATEPLNPFDALVRSEVYRLVHSALKDLTTASRKVVIMHYLEGKSTGQISRELNLHPSTIKTQKKQGFEALRKAFVKSGLWLLWLCTEIFSPIY